MSVNARDMWQNDQKITTAVYSFRILIKYILSMFENRLNH